MSQSEGTHSSLSVLCTFLFSSSRRELGNAPLAGAGSPGTAPYRGQGLLTDPGMWLPPHSRAGLGSLWLWCQLAQVPALRKELFAIISWSYLTELLPRGEQRYRPRQQPPKTLRINLGILCIFQVLVHRGFSPFFPSAASA